MKVPFNIPATTGNELKYIAQTFENNKLSGDGSFTNKCSQWFEREFECAKVLLTTSCTHALEMCAILTNIKEGDEVIIPSFTFVSTANAFALRGARLVFVDIRPDTLNIDEEVLESAITERTKAIVVVHYAGVSCEMDRIMEIANKHELVVIEDAAQAVMSKYKGKPLGTIGHLGCFSFHDTKNYTSGEGGALLINDERFIQRAEVIREKGTNRSSFLRGQVDKYTWIDIGSSYLPSELNAACLYAQLEQAEEINQDRLNSWQLYYNSLQPLVDIGLIELPGIPEECQHNAAIFYFKVKTMEERCRLISYLREKGIGSAFHYIPLHNSEAGREYGKFRGIDFYTTETSETIIRLPMFYGLTEAQNSYVVEKIKEFYGV